MRYFSNRRQGEQRVMTGLLKTERMLDRFSDGVGALSAILMVPLVANVFYDVVMRYLLNDVSIGMQELEWHLYSAIFLLGIAYTLKADGHVRVDVIHERLDARWRALIDMCGTVIFIWPFCLLIAYFGLEFAQGAYRIGETSGDPGGLPYRWVIKGMIPLSFACVLISSVGFFLRALNEFLGSKGDANNTGPMSANTTRRNSP
uniref:TRAP transporter small permease protein n=1 Tax=Candidatus Kentrum sp. UNK TaxID=2126344 RepID=A0A451B500_9GAMM|nr:MAG: TRAP-type mannitol/chloroaromatic compound transport system, small permease component [Candidatus Kentron sp. UNK]VFK73359.1 MAG: TRAP-type mannitol/chloroaromatic compound transport system, small permease component [Candidatus Kentron sp. UNK]